VVGIAALAEGGDCSSVAKYQSSYSCAALILPATLVFGGLGAGIGALIGSDKRDRWESVDLSRLQPVVSLLPQRNHSPAICIGLRLRI